jgi:rhodanese-related sulfurtransferase
MNGFDTDLEISVEALAAAMKADASRVTIVDVRNGPEHAFASLPGSIHVPLDDLASRVSNLEIPEGNLVAVLCHHGRRSIPGTLALREAGWAGAKSITGGIERWSLVVDPKVPRYKRDGLRVWPA